MLEGLFGEYHSSSAALGKQCLGVTKQPPFGDWGGQQQHPNVADVYNVASLERRGQVGGRGVKNGNR